MWVLLVYKDIISCIRHASRRLYRRHRQVHGDPSTRLQTWIRVIRQCRKMGKGYWHSIISYIKYF